MLPSLEPGTMLAGKLRVERVIGQGGMGVVVAALHVGLDTRVAVKILLPELARQTDTVARFVREGRSAVRIRSEHVARVLDVGTLESGLPYIVQELLEGSDIDAIVQARGPFAAPHAVEIMLQTCEALAEAHSLGIIHRDLKPSNLFLTKRTDGSTCVKVIDFGISKVTAAPGSAPSQMTQTRTMIGSPLYMSPEQLESARDVDARSDIWALGVILYELLTATPPFIADALPQLCVKILTAEAPPMSSLRADIPPGLEAIVQRCLRKDRTQRFADVAELALALGPHAPRRARTSVERIQRVLHGSEGMHGSDAPMHDERALGHDEHDGGLAGEGVDHAGVAAASPDGSGLAGARLANPQRATVGEWASTGHGVPRRPPIALLVAALLSIVAIAGGVYAWRASSAAHKDASAAASSGESAQAALASPTMSAAAGEPSARTPEVPPIVRPAAPSSERSEKSEKSERAVVAAAPSGASATPRVSGPGTRRTTPAASPSAIMARGTGRPAGSASTSAATRPPPRTGPTSDPFGDDRR